MPSARRYARMAWKSGCRPFSPVPRLIERTGMAAQMALTSARVRYPIFRVSR
jgi:hypothetical protein